MRRSHASNGSIPHFGVAETDGFKALKVIEYIPPKRRLWTSRDKMFLFEGSYRVWRFRLESVTRCATRAEAVK